MTVPTRHRLRIELLGQLRARQGSRTISRFATRKTAALLAYLAYHPGAPQPREELADLLWPDSDLTAARKSISQALSSLRHQVEPPGIKAGTIIQADRDHVQLNAEVVTTDVAEFRQTLRRAAAPGAGPAAALAEAVRLYGGQLLPGHYQDRVLRERDALQESYLQVLDRLRQLAERAGDRSRALELAARVVATDPLREAAHRDLMRLHAATGQRAAAVRQFRKLAKILKDELDVEPAPETVRLLAAVRSAAPEAARGAAVPRGEPRAEAPRRYATRDRQRAQRARQRRREPRRLRRLPPLSRGMTRDRPPARRPAAGCVLPRQPVQPRRPRGRQRRGGLVAPAEHRRTAPHRRPALRRGRARDAGRPARARGTRGLADHRARDVAESA